MAECNLKQLTFGKFIHALELEIQALKAGEPNLKPYLALGAPGIGKTAAIAALAKQHNIGFKEIRLASLDRADLTGMPSNIKDDKGQLRTVYGIADLLPTVESDGEIGIVVFDELFAAPSDVQTAALQLFDGSRSVGTYKLPDRWFCVALSNGPDDGGEQVRGMSNAMLNRFNACNVEIDFAYWKVWAADPNKGNIHPGILAFLNANPAYAHVMPPEDSEYPAEMFPSFRSWETASKMLRRVERFDNNGQPLTNQDEAAEAVGWGIGDRASHDFGAFYVHNTSLVKAEEIFAGKAPTKLPNKQVTYLSGQYLVSAIFQLIKENIATYNEKGTFPKSVVDKVKNAVKWLMNVSTMDFCSCMMQDITHCAPPFADIVLSDDFEFPGSTEFLDRYGDLLRAK